MTKQERRDGLVRKYINSEKTSVYAIYKRPSDRKVAIEACIKIQMLELNGSRYRVLVGNSFVFTCAYSYKREGKWYMHWESARSTLEYELTDEEVKKLCL